MQESYNKRLNILIHGIEEDENQVREKRETTIEKFEKFRTDGLNIDPDNIEVADIHRLPQYPITKNWIKVNYCWLYSEQYFDYCS